MPGNARPHACQPMQGHIRASQCKVTYMPANARSHTCQPMQGHIRASQCKDTYVPANARSHTCQPMQGHIHASQCKVTYVPANARSHTCVMKSNSSPLSISSEPQTNQIGSVYSSCQKKLPESVHWLFLRMKKCR